MLQLSLNTKKVLCLTQIMFIMPLANSKEHTINALFNSLNVLVAIE